MLVKGTESLYTNAWVTTNSIVLQQFLWVDNKVSIRSKFRASDWYDGHFINLKECIVHSKSWPECINNEIINWYTLSQCLIG